MTLFKMGKFTKKTKQPSASQEWSLREQKALETSIWERIDPSMRMKREAKDTRHMHVKKHVSKHILFP